MGLEELKWRVKTPFHTGFTILTAKIPINATFPERCIKNIIEIVKKNIAKKGATEGGVGM